MNTHLLHYFNTFEDISFESTIAPIPIQHCESYLGARNPKIWNVKKSFSNDVDEYSKDGICCWWVTYPKKLIFCIISKIIISISCSRRIYYTIIMVMTISNWPISIAKLLWGIKNCISYSTTSFIQWYSPDFPKTLLP